MSFRNRCQPYSEHIVPKITGLSFLLCFCFCFSLSLLLCLLLLLFLLLFTFAFAFAFAFCFCVCVCFCLCFCFCFLPLLLPFAFSFCFAFCFCCCFCFCVRFCFSLLLRLRLFFSFAFAFCVCVWNARCVAPSASCGRDLNWSLCSSERFAQKLRVSLCSSERLGRSLKAEEGCRGVRQRKVRFDWELNCEHNWIELNCQIDLSWCTWLNTWLILVFALEMVEAGSKHCGLGASTGPTRGDSQSAMFQANIDHFNDENKDKSNVDQVS